MAATLPIAVLIDAENISAKHFPAIHAHARRHGSACLLRAFGDFSETRLGKWVELARDGAIELRMQVSAGKLRNSADIAISIEAMDLLHRREAAVICLVSSDADFAPLALRLRAGGLVVHGLGEAKAAPALRNAFSRFLELPPLVRAPAGAARVARSADLSDEQKRSVGDILRRLCSQEDAGAIPPQILAKALQAEAPEIANLMCGKGRLMKRLRALDTISETEAGGTLRIRPKDRSLRAVA